MLINEIDIDDDNTNTPGKRTPLHPAGPAQYTSFTQEDFEKISNL